MARAASASSTSPSCHCGCRGRRSGRRHRGRSRRERDAGRGRAASIRRRRRGTQPVAGRRAAETGSPVRRGERPGLIEASGRQCEHFDACGVDYAHQPRPRPHPAGRLSRTRAGPAARARLASGSSPLCGRCGWRVSCVRVLPRGAGLERVEVAARLRRELDGAQAPSRAQGGCRRRGRRSDRAGSRARTRPPRPSAARCTNGRRCREGEVAS